MSRRSALPGADELFRSTGDGRDELPVAPSGPAQLLLAESAALTAAGPRLPARPPTPAKVGVRRPEATDGERRGPTGRERHDEKITVYVSAEELMDLERARLTLRGDHGLAVDRGRIVREALAVVLADLVAEGDASVLVRRFRSR